MTRLSRRQKTQWIKSMKRAGHLWKKGVLRRRFKFQPLFVARAKWGGWTMSSQP
jgi:hypothetical protein